MLPEERRRKILEIINKEKKVTVKDLSREFKIPFLTVRRDLNNLQERGYLKKVYGGAILSEIADSRIISFPVYREEQLKNIREKRAIAAEASKRIADGSSIIILSGTTCEELCRHLVDKKDLKIVTAAPNILNELARIEIQQSHNFCIISTGGILQLKSNIMIGPHASKLLSSIKVDIAFFTAVAIDLKEGITSADSFDAEITKSAIDCARKKVALIDSSKFGKSSFVKVVPVSLLDEIITDSGLNPKFASDFVEAGITLTVVKL